MLLELFLFVFSPYSYHVVEQMRQGVNASAACSDAVRRIARRYPGFSGAVVALNKLGGHGQ